MFTGLVQALGRVRAAGDSQLVVETGLRAEPGASVAVNGCCLTVTTCADGALTFDVMPATFERTSLGVLVEGASVNLEPALRMGDPLGGHWVQGHVDATGEVESVTPDGNAHVVRLRVPASISRLCVDRGSITIDGVSLTVMGVEDAPHGAADGVEASISVSLIPETRERTNLGSVAPGTRVNLEADILAKYVERLLPQRNA